MKRSYCKILRVLVCLAFSVSSAWAAEEKIRNDTPGFGNFALCNLTGYQSQSSSPALAIPDNDATGVTTAALQFADGGLINDVVIELNLTHTWVGDLQAIVSYDETGDGSVEATAIILCRARGTSSSGPLPCGDGTTAFGCSADLVAVNTLQFDDTAANAVADGVCTDPVPAGCYRSPAQGGTPLSVFENRPMGGKWTLTVVDLAQADTGTLDSWTVNVLPQPNSIGFEAPSGEIPIGGCATVDVNVHTTNPARLASITIELSQELALCNATPVTSITRGSWLDAYNNSYFVSEAGTNAYKIDQSALGAPCGPTGGGHLFRIAVKATGVGGPTGTISFKSPASTQQIFPCSGSAFTPSAGGAVTVDIESPGPAPDPVTNLVITQVLTGNDDNGTTKTKFEYTLPAGAVGVDIYSAPFGNHPEYDDAPGGFALRNVNFQPTGATIPTGYEADTGLPFDAGRGYGWLSGPLSTTARNLLAGDPRDTFAYSFNADPSGVWEIQVGAGDRSVRVMCGDPFTQGRHRVTIEGVVFLDNVLTNGAQYAQATQTVTVGADGLLTVSIGGAGLNVPPLSHTKINFIEVSSVASGPSGSVPTFLAALPGAGSRYTLAASPTGAGPAFVDDAPRDYYFYAVFARDAAGNRSSPVNGPNGVLNYHLGDIFDATPGVQCAGDNLVGFLTDFSFFASLMNLPVPSGHPGACADIGPLGTTPPIVGLPQTDSFIGADDLAIISANLDAVSKAVATPAPMDANTLEIVNNETAEALSADLLLQGAGNVRAMVVQLGWNPAIVEPIGITSGPLLAEQGGVALQAGPGGVGIALTGARELGFTGQGVAASVRFHRLAPGDPAIGVLAIDARDMNFQPIDIALGQSPTGVKGVPRVSAILSNVPNPFNPSTKITYALAKPGRTRMSVYGLDGRLVRRLIDGDQEAGLQHVIWDGTNAAGHKAASGVYYVRLVTLDGTTSRPVVLVK